MLEYDKQIIENRKYRLNKSRKLQSRSKFTRFWMIRDISELIVALIQFISTYLQIVAFQVSSQIAHSQIMPLSYMCGKLLMTFPL